MNGLMEGSMKDSGKITKCMGLECLAGLMAGNIKGIMLKIKSKDTEFLNGNSY
jgi:hypothetical protein